MLKQRIYQYSLIVLSILMSYQINAEGFSTYNIKLNQNQEHELFSNTYLFFPGKNKYRFNEVRNFEAKKYLEVKTMSDSILGPIGGYVWARINIENTTKTDLPFIVVPGANIELLEYKIYKDKRSDVVSSGLTGMEIRPENRPAKIGSTGIPFVFKANTKYTIIYKIKTFYLMEAALLLKSHEAYEEENIVEVLFWMMFVGLMLTQCLYNMYRYFSSKDLNYLNYSVFCFLTILNLVCLIENVQTVLYIFIGGIHKYLYIIAAAASLSGIIFTSEFINMRKYMPKIYKVLWSIIVLIFLSAIIPFIVEEQFENMSKIFMVLSPVNILMMMGSILYIIVKYKRYENIGILLAFLSLLVSVSVGHGIASTGTGITRITNMFFGVGVIIEVFIMSYTLSRKINNYKLNLYKELDLQEKILIKEVDQKSKEVIAATDDLHKAESMKCLGVVGAALAHEINNPLSIIQGNITRLSRGMERELPKFTGNINGNIAEMSQSVNNIAEIIKSIYFFSKDDGDLITMSNINLKNVIDEVVQELKDKEYFVGIDFDYSTVPSGAIITAITSLSI